MVRQYLLLIFFAFVVIGTGVFAVSQVLVYLELENCLQNRGYWNPEKNACDFNSRTTQGELQHAHPLNGKRSKPLHSRKAIDTHFGFVYRCSLNHLYLSNQDTTLYYW